MPFNRQRSNRGGKPLVSVGVNCATRGASELLLPHAVHARFRSDAAHSALRSESSKEAFQIPGRGLTAWVSDWYRSKE